MSARIVAAGGVLSLVTWSWLTLGSQSAGPGTQTGRIAPFLAAWGVAFIAYLVALTRSSGLSKRGLRAALVLAVLWRVGLALGPPLLSDDVYRCVWEGRIQLHGGNPFQWTDRPEAEKWRPLRDDIWQNVNHKDYAAIYPPLWQLAVRAAIAIHDSVVAVKLLTVACELLTWWALAAALRVRGLPRGRLLILAWSPLALVEIAGSGHNDALGILATAVAVGAVYGARPALAAGGLAAGIAAKLLPGLFAIAWWRHFRPAHFAAIAAGTLLISAPYLGAREHLWHSLGKYSQYWRFNETGFAILADLGLGHVGAVIAGALASVVLAFFLGQRRVDPALAGTALVVTWLLLAPNVLPWYALWLLPFLVLRDEPAALLFTGSVAFAYLVYPIWQSGERWQVSWGIRALEYGPCFGVAIASRLRRSAAPAAS